MSQDNTKENRIRRTQSKAKKNKVEDHLRTVKSSLNKKSVVDSKATSSVLNSVSNVNFDLKCASCNGCLFSDNHDACVVDYIKYVNARRTFKLVGNVCPLTKIATPTIVPPREPIPIVNSMDKPVVTLVYTRKPKAANKKVPNKLKPNHSWGSSSSNVPSSLLTCRLSKSSSGTWTPIMGYGDYQIGNVTISHVYYMEGLGNNLFSIRQFCDSDLEVAFRQHTCFIRNLDGASNTKSWLWHRRLSHLNFGAINHLARQVLYEVRLNVSAQCIRTDNGTEFVNQTLRDYYEEVGISHETSVARSLQQNGVVERRNRTLIKAARTMLIYTQAPLFLWAEAMATACFTQNRSIIRLRHGKTPYELLHSKLPDLSFFHVFGALCYPTNDSENLVDQDAPSSSKSLTPTEIQSSVILQDVGNDNLDMKVTHMGNDPLLGVPILEVTSDQSSSTASPQSNVQPNHPMTHHNSK
nr:integrase, catalytic region, zinc finger, CCHC-type, peptidase aspartic, catalytic [Tanacetum cinerariifolium]